jgi:hypothetical protein
MKIHITLLALAFVGMAAEPLCLTPGTAATVTLGQIQANP